ncbi:MAG: hypothetical protein BWK79_05820 [Beggiatoa sp. IS2]|nr:MAG: hypothetical protein BWK79_05820 [Beggiatoa sp. IS2]
MNQFKRTLAISSLALPLLSLNACAVEGETVLDSKPESQTSATAPEPKPAAIEVNAVANSINAFATDLYAQLETSTQGNLVISPYSISSALSMTYAGAKGETEKQMAQVLHYTVGANIHPIFSNLQKSLTANNENGVYQLQIANALWYEESLFSTKTATDYADLLEKNYSARLHSVKFKNVESARQEINNWTADETEHKIKDLLKPGALSANTKLVLTNALYFLGSWQSPFEESNTKELPFIMALGKTEQVLTMSQDKTVNYWDTADFQAVELPYKKGNLSMAIVLPKEGKKLGINAFLGSMDKPEKQFVKIFLPKFKVETEFQLGDALQKLGMVDAFDASKANFSGINGSKNDLAIAAVVHKTFVDVNEKGTEAAAATAVVMARGIQLPPKVEFRVDRPFFFLIKDNDSGTILFLGHVANPKG